MEEIQSVDDVWLAKQRAAYDAAAKKLLSSKKILAWILKYCVEEFMECEIADIRDRYIVGKPEVASVPIEPDKTNAISYIQGERTEDTSVTEGKVTFDIRFRAITPADEAIELIINVEAQQNISPGYPLVKRALYYCSRLISSQYQVDFVKAEYGHIKKVYSIWLCMDAKADKSGITQYQMQEHCLWEDIHDEKANYDLIRAVMVYIGSHPKDFGNRLMGLLYTLFKSDNNAANKKSILQKEYDVDLEETEAKEMNDMCNLSMGIYQKGIKEGEVIGLSKGEAIGLSKGEAIGMSKGEAIGMSKGVNKVIVRMLQNRMPLEVISENTDQPVAYIKKLAQENNIPCQ